MSGSDPVIRVTVVIPVLDEVATLPRLFESLRSQTEMPTEVIVVDGGSTDGTPALVRKLIDDPQFTFPIRLLELARSRPGRSRNAGASAATTDLIACSDAGVTLHEEWLASLVAPLLDGSGHGVAIGSFVAQGETPFERLIGKLLIRPADKVRIQNAGGVSIAFTQAALRTVGGYPDDVYPCEDAHFLRDLKRAGIPIARANGAMSYWRRLVKSLEPPRRRFQVPSM